jgi:hypothetical protein
MLKVWIICGKKIHGSCQKDNITSLAVIIITFVSKYFEVSFSTTKTTNVLPLK